MWGAAAAIALSSCTGRSEYMVEYAPVDSIPYNVETNAAATTFLTGSYPGVYIFRSVYSQYDATVYYGLVAIPDSAKIKKVLRLRFDSMADKMGIYEGDIRTLRPDTNLIGWVIVTPECVAPVQMMVTDSATMALHATMKFNSMQTDSTGFIMPAIDAIAADMAHLVNNLKLQ